MIRHGDFLKKRNYTFEMTGKGYWRPSGFEPKSIEPKSTSLDQANQQPIVFC